MRALRTSEPGFLYAAADEIADFGSPRTSLDLSVAQVGLTAGPGPARRDRIPIRAG